MTFLNLLINSFLIFFFMKLFMIFFQIYIEMPKFPLKKKKKIWP